VTHKWHSRALDGDLPGCGGGVDGEVKLDKTGGNLFVENESTTRLQRRPVSRSDIAKSA
jgi:hypothetical protein